MLLLVYVPSKEQLFTNCIKIININKNKLYNGQIIYIYIYIFNNYIIGNSL